MQQAHTMQEVRVPPNNLRPVSWNFSYLEFIAGGNARRLVRTAGIRNETCYNGRFLCSNSQEKPMYKIEQSKTGITLQVAGRARPGKAAEKG